MKTYRVTVDTSLFDMANVNKSRTGLPVNIWLDSLGRDRNGAHNEVRCKVQTIKSNDNDRSNLTTVIVKPNQAEFAVKYKGDMTSKEQKEVLDYIAQRSEIVIQHYNKEIDDLEALSRMCR